MKRIWARVLEMLAVPMPDAVTHVLHWMVTIVVTSLIAAFGEAWIYKGALFGYITSEIILLAACLWEGFNYGTHKANGDDMKRWTKDGVWDLAGPVLNRLIWTAVFFT